MDRRRRNFILALGLFAAWIGVLGAMAWLSADRPQQRRAAAAVIPSAR